MRRSSYYRHAFRVPKNGAKRTELPFVPYKEEQWEVAYEKSQNSIPDRSLGSDSSGSFFVTRDSGYVYRYPFSRACDSG
jgi:hypothetical protein